MTWFDDYDRGYGRARRGRGGMYDRENRQPGDWRRGTAWNSDYTADRFGYGGDRQYGWSGNRNAYETDYLGRRHGYGRDYGRYASEYLRRPPQESPTYGRGGDQAVQRWARRYGYDMQYEVPPRGGQGPWGGQSRERGYRAGQGGWGREGSATGGSAYGRGGTFDRGYER